MSTPKTLSTRAGDVTMFCAARTNRIVPCGGELIPSEGLCLNHAILFDVWICGYGGFRVYQTEHPRNWKRSKFHHWLNEIGNKQATKILNS